MSGFGFAHGVTTHARRQLVGLVAGLLAGAALVGLVVLVVQTYSLASAIREQQKSNTATNALVVSCVTPRGDCYQRAERRNAANVTDIGLLATFAAACADRDGVQTIAEIRACVLRQAAKAPHR